MGYIYALLILLAVAAVVAWRLNRPRKPVEPGPIGSRPPKGSGPIRPK